MMPKSLRWLIAVCTLAVLLHGSAHAQTQKRNFNLNCGLIGSFARYPQHVQGCKALLLCTDPKTCVRKSVLRQRKLEAFISLEELTAPLTGASPEIDASAGGLSVSVGVQGHVTAGGMSANGGVSAGAGADSNGGASGSASGGAGAGGVSAGTGGGLGLGGL